MHFDLADIQFILYSSRIFDLQTSLAEKCRGNFLPQVLQKHTPRDFIQLMNCIKGQCVAPKVRTVDIETGFKKYSADYFLHEIQDEMTGYVSSEDIETIIGAMSSLHKREFTYDELLGSIEKRYPSLANLEDILWQSLNVNY